MFSNTVVHLGRINNAFTLQSMGIFLVFTLNHAKIKQVQFKCLTRKALVEMDSYSADTSFKHQWHIFYWEVMLSSSETYLSHISFGYYFITHNKRLIVYNVTQKVLSYARSPIFNNAISNSHCISNSLTRGCQYPKHAHKKLIL